MLLCWIRLDPWSGPCVAIGRKSGVGLTLTEERVRMFSLGKEENSGGGRECSGSFSTSEWSYTKDQHYPLAFLYYILSPPLSFFFFFLFLLLLLHSNQLPPSPLSLSFHSESIPRPFDLLTFIGQEPTLIFFSSWWHRAQHTLTPSSPLHLPSYTSYPSQNAELILWSLL